MGKDKELFRVCNSDWIVAETSPGLYELSLQDGSKKMEGLTIKQVVTAQGVLSEVERHMKEDGR